MRKLGWPARSMLIVGLLVAGSALAGIQGTKHDFSTEGWSGGKICLPCHTPHNGRTDVGAPLWNHAMTEATFSLYSSPTMDVTVEQPGMASKVCLSCHDGTVAMDSFGGVTGTTFMSGNAVIGTDLADDHPVGIAWEHQTLETSAACTNCHFGGDTRPELPFFAGKIECSSCHDAHGGPAGSVKLLREPVAGSALCLHCHEK